MSLPDWKILASVTVPALPDGYWTLAVDWLEAPGWLRLKVVSTAPWQYAADAVCFADGDLLSALDAGKCILKNAPVGALIGKVGGSTAEHGDGFVVGRLCVKDLIEKPPGPLFLTINDVPTGFDRENAGEMVVEVEFAKAPPESIGGRPGNKPDPNNPPADLLKKLGLA